MVGIEISRDQVSVPKVEAPKLPESVPLGEGVLSCLKHPTIPAVWHCSKCGKFYCTACTRDVHLVGQPAAHEVNISVCTPCNEKLPALQGGARLPGWSDV